MEFTSLILPLTKNICRTCLMESDTNMFMSIQDLIEHETNKVKLIDILVFLNCLENNDEENWPQGMCGTCVSTALVAYTFKFNCLKANSALSQIFTLQTSLNLQRSDIDSIDINVVYQDHEYDVPLFSNHPTLDFESSLSSNKELTPLPPVTEITSGEQPPRKQGEKRFSCMLCSKSFTRLNGLKYHMFKHTGEKKHLCPKCGKRFYNSTGLQQHLISHKDTSQFKCGFCNKVYKGRHSLKEHFRLAHSSNKKAFECVTCGKKFTAKSTLAAHMRSHNGQKIACPNCPKTFTRASYLKYHSFIHSGQERPKPFVCNYQDCDRKFATKYSLLVHIAHTHTATRPHKCDVCKRGFVTAANLKVHKEQHVAKDIFCNVCEKKFSNKGSLQKHMRIHNVDDNDMILETVDNVFYDCIINPELM